MSTQLERTSNNRSSGDAWILILTVLLAAFGVVAIYSASNYAAQTQYGDKWYFVKKQLLGFFLGIVAMIICGRVDYRRLQGKRIRWFALLFPMLLLALVFVPGIGKSNYGATRWIGVGGITIQPSELAKYGFVVFASAYMSQDIGKLRTFKGIMPVLLAGGGICGLIIIEPNMSVTMCVGMYRDAGSHPDGQPRGLYGDRVPSLGRNGGYDHRRYRRGGQCRPDQDRRAQPQRPRGQV